MCTGPHGANYPGGDMCELKVQGGHMFWNYPREHRKLRNKEYM